MHLFVELCKSKDKDTTYHVLKCDFGYRTAIVSMEKDLCAEMLGITLAELYTMKVGEVRQVGEVSQVNVKGGK